MIATVSVGTSASGDLLDDPGLLVRDAGEVVAEVFGWSRPIGVITATWASMTLVASHVPPRPTSTTATSTGASANAANAIAVSISNLLIAGPPAAVDCCVDSSM